MFFLFCIIHPSGCCTTGGGLRRDPPPPPPHTHTHTHTTHTIKRYINASFIHILFMFGCEKQMTALSTVDRKSIICNHSSIESVRFKMDACFLNPVSHQHRPLTY